MVARRHAADTLKVEANPKKPQKLLKRGIAGLAAAAVVASGLVMVNTAAYAASPLTGKVFVDYAGDGVYTNDQARGSRDTLLGGVLVTAYNSAGQKVASATTESKLEGESNYTLQLPDSVSDGEALRIEFTNVPSGLKDSFSASASSVQFAAAGQEASVDYGVFDPAMYVPDANGVKSAPLFTAIQSAGIPDATTSSASAIVGTAWNVAPNPEGSIVATDKSEKLREQTQLATYAEVGSVWGLAYNVEQNSLYSAATLKRNSALGSLGLGGIYLTKNAVVDGVINKGAKTEPYVDVTKLGIDVGTVSSNEDRGLGGANKITADIEGFAKAGKVGIGGVAATVDGKHLLFVNLDDKSVYTLNTPADGTPTKASGGVALGLGEHQQPWALSIYRDEVFVGYVDTGVTPGKSASAEGMNAYVVKAPLADVIAGNAAWTNVLTADLGYQKGNSANNWVSNPLSYANKLGSKFEQQIVRWNAWTDIWSWDGNDATATTDSKDIAIEFDATKTADLSDAELQDRLKNHVADSVGIRYNGMRGNGSEKKIARVQMYPQPMLTGLTIDRDGYLTLGFLDRTSVQGSNLNVSATEGVENTKDHETFESLSSGDVLLAAPNALGGFTLENNGSAGEKEGAQHGAEVYRDKQGPGGREFYQDSQNADFLPNGNHQENALGAVVAYPGGDEVVSSAFDPLATVRDVGVEWFSTDTGANLRGYEHTVRKNNLGDGSFQKGGGMGGLALALKAAPVEIGNRTWLDLDGDGVQDANEPSISGVTVTLYRADAEGKPTGEPLGTKQTDKNGNYFFRSEDAPTGGTAGFKRGADGTFGDYVVVFEAPDTDAVTLQNADGTDYKGATQYNWNQLLFTQPNAGGDEGQADERDSDAIEVPRNDGLPATVGYAKVSVGSAGQNNHSIDAGWKPGTVTVGNYVWNDADNNGIQDEENAGISGVALKIYLVEGDKKTELKTDAFGQPFTKNVTDTNGLYLFENLPVLKPGQSYKVEIDKSAASTKTALEGFVPTKTGQGTTANDSSTDFADTKKAGKETTDETILNVPGRSDLTLDFGFFKAVPNGTIVKKDAAGNDANTESGAVDLAAASGETTIVFTITNTGNEPLTDIAIDDVVVGSGKLGEIKLSTPDGDVVITKENPWKGSLAIGESLTAKAKLTGVEAGVPHSDVATLWAKGTLSGKPVVDPNNPGTPEEPNRPNDPYNAKFDTYAIGDYVWIDKNRDGQQDGDEAPLAGVTVNLLDADGNPTGKTTTTDEHGHYKFDELPAGTYKVQFELPEGYVFTTANAENVPTGANSDADVKTGLTKVIELGETNENLVERADVKATKGIDPTWDAGVVPPSVSVGDFVWQDLNNDGLQTPGEPGIDDVTLTLTGPDGKPVKNVYGEEVKPVVTKEGGKYEFTNLPVLKEGESYTVTISNVPEKFKPTTAGTNNGAGADDSSTDTAVSGPLTTDQANDPTLDFGFVLKTPGATLNKSDAEARDANDPKSPVDLSSKQGQIEIVFTIANNGEEPITNIGLADASSGSGEIVYPIVVTTDKGQKFSLASADARWEGELAVGEIATGRAMLTGVTAGKPHRNDVTLFADGVYTKKPVEDPTNPSDDPGKPNRPTDPYNAVVKTYAIGDFVWLDSTPNGVQDKDEPGIAGAKVYLLDEKGNRIDGKVTETDKNGFYKFDNLGAGTYQVEFELPFGYVLVDPDQGSDDAKDSDALPTEGSNRTKGKTITVVLDDSNKSLEKREGVEASEGIDPTWDAGVRLATVSVGDKVWIDKNRDGRQDPNEPGIDGVTLEIFNPKGEKVGETTTRDGGKYLFEGLPVLAEGESYTVKIDKEKSKDALKDLVPTKNGVGDREGDSSTWEATTEGLTRDGEKDLTLDFGFVSPSVTVGDRVWEDVNRDGLQSGEGETPERGIGGVVLTIVGPDGRPVTDVFGNPVGPQTTDENGKYLFENLPALAEGQSYTVKIDRDASAEALRGFEPTKETEGNRENDSSTWSATTQGLTENGEKDLTLDFGFIRAKVEIGDKVWKDINRDGRQDENEPGIPGIVLVVTDEDGNPVKDINGKPVAPVTTDENGNYRFVDLPVLPEGKSYVVTIDKSASQEALGNLIPTVSGEGDREGDSSEWTEKTQGLTKDGEKDLTLDFGFIVPKVSVGDRVWFDANKDGRQSFGEPGIVGVVLKLVGPDGEPVTDVFGKPVEPVKTDENGNYLFENLPALAAGQSYKVVLDAKASAEALKGLVPTTPGAGDREGDSSTDFATSQGLTKDGESDLTLDFGFVLVTVDTPLPPSLARTGSDMFPVLPIGLGGLGLMLLGAGAVLATRKRNQLSA